MLEMVEGEVESKSRKLLRKWSLSPIRTHPGQRARARARRELSKIIRRELQGK
jgi:hypothetical protein